MSVTIGGIERIAAKLTTTRIKPAIEAGCMAVAAELQNELAAYPRASGKPQAFKSAKQRRYVMMLIRAGKVPYKRTGNLGQRWHIRRISLGAVLSNASGYARYVYGMPQAAYHRGTWPSIAAAARKIRPRVAGIIRAALEDTL
jgi:hypothetical protein